MPEHKTEIHIDFETYSEADIRDVGAWVMSRHPTTEVICASIAYNDDAPVCYLTHAQVKAAVKKALAHKDATIMAFNSFFECCIIANVLKLDIGPFEQWRDVMAQAAAAAVPQDLLRATEVVLGADSKSVKSKRGKLLIQRLSKLQSIRVSKLLKTQLWLDHHPDFKIADGTDIRDLSSSKSVRVHPRYREDYQSQRLEMYDYCDQDVVAERALAKALRPLSTTEQAVWVQDQVINWRGVKCDLDMCHKMHSVFRQEVTKNLGKMAQITGLENPNSNVQLMGWLKSRVDIVNLQAPTVKEFLQGEDIPDEVEQVLKLRQSVARTPPAKYLAMINRADPDTGLVHGMFSFHRASTGRWSSRGVNLQNMPRPTFDDYEDAIGLIYADEAESFHWTYGDMIDGLCSLLRAALVPRQGNEFVVSDYSAIEAIVLPWLAGEEKVLEIFRKDGRLYEHTAAGIYGKPVASIASDSRERFVGKTATLSLGYQGGHRAFISMAKVFGVDMDETFAKRVVANWREDNPNIVKLWHACQRAAVYAISNPGKARRVNDYLVFKVSTYGEHPYLLCRLPSGRMLSYFRPKLMQGRYGKEITFLGTDSNTGQWSRQKTYGGSLVENITQGTARDILAYAITRAGKTKSSIFNNIVLHVHDELVMDIKKGEMTVDQLNAFMTTLPSWAEGIPLSASGGKLTRYWK